MPQPPQLGGGIKLLCFSIHTACNPLCLNIRLRTIYGGCGRSNRLFSLFFPHHPLRETFPCSRSKQNRRNRPGVFLFFFFSWHMSFNCTCITWEGLGLDVKHPRTGKLCEFFKSIRCWCKPSGVAYLLHQDNGWHPSVPMNDSWSLVSILLTLS